MTYQAEAKQKIKIENFTKDEIAVELYNLSRERKLAERYAQKFAQHSVLSAVFNVECVQSNVHQTIQYVVNAWEVYTKKKLEARKKEYQKKGNRKKVKEINVKLKGLNPFQDVNLSKNTRLDNLSQLEGYFVRSIQNNLSKAYARETRGKRISSGFVYIDSADESQKNYFESLLVQKDNGLEFHKSLKVFIEFLEKEDAKINEGNSLGVSTKVSCMAQIFEGLLAPSYRGRIFDLANRLGLPEYEFKRQRKLMAKKLRLNFMESGQDLLKFIEESNSLPVQIVDYSKKSNKYDYYDTSLKTSVVYSQKKNGDKNEYAAKVFLSKKDGRGVYHNIEEKERVLVIEDNSKSFSQIKEILSIQIEEDLAEMNKKAQSIRAKAFDYFSK